MHVKGVQHRLDFLTRRLSPPEWLLLAAIAVERELGLTIISRLASSFGVVSSAPAGSGRGAAQAVARAASPGASRQIGTLELEQLSEWMRTGLLLEVGRARPSALARRSAGEPSYAVEPEFRQLVVRRVAARGELARVVEATHGLLGDRSLGVFALLLAAGRLGEFERFAYTLPRASGRLGEAVSAHELLCESVLRPFDPDWFTQTFGEMAARAAEQVLGAALADLEECDALYAWARAELGRRTLADGTSANSDRTASASLAVCEHGVLRGRPEDLEALVSELPPRARAAVEAASCFLLADLPAAHERLIAADASARDAKKPLTLEPLGVAPLCALISYSRGTPEGLAEAKRWLAARPADVDSGATNGNLSPAARTERAFRTLVRYGSLPEGECQRLDVHQLGRDAKPWELFLLGLTVHLHLPQEVTRAGWAVELVRSGAAWLRAGYGWFGRQALFLARALSAEYFAREFEKVKESLFLESLEQRPGELLLCELISPKPGWQRALDALAELAEQPSAEAEAAMRVAWFVNMVDGSLERPALQRLESGGWTRGRRLPVAELLPHIAELPPEDQRVLRASDIGAEKREPSADAVEALIDHPRVFNGARGGARVEVVRGVCRIETDESRDHLTLVVRPAGLKPGLNLVPEHEGRLVVYRMTPAMRRAVDVLGPGLSVPKQHEEQALRVLGKLSQGMEVQSRHLGADRSVEADATPCLRISPHAGAWLVQAGVRPFGVRGRFFLAGTGRASLSLYTGGERLLCTRDFALEKARMSRLIQSCPALLERTLDPEAQAPREALESWDFGLEGVLELLGELAASPERAELEWPESEPLRVRGILTRKSLHGTLRRKKGWYLMTGGAKLDAGAEVSFSELAEASVLEKGRFVRLPSGDYLAVEERVLRVMAALEQTRPLSQRGDVQIHPGALGLLEAIDDVADGAESGFAVDAEARSFLDRAATLQNKTFEPPERLTAVLRNYQLDGFRWLCRLSELGLGACLADDMGLGKTLQILALLLTRTDQGPCLVVAPTSVCSNWVLEAARFAPSLRVEEYAGPNRAELLERLQSPKTAPEIVVTSYGLVQQDIEALAALEWGTVVLDEAQFIKNAQSQRARAVCRLNAKCRIAATGTPVENHVGDLWSIFNFLNPGLLGPWRSFQRRFLKPIEQRRDLGTRDVLAHQTRPFMLRRTKAEVLADLPPLTVVNHAVQLSEAETAAYALLRRQIHDKLHTPQGRRDNKLEILAEITRLRRFCCHPRLVFPEAQSDASKVQSLLDLVLELRENEHRALVFSQFVDFLDIIRERLDEAGVTYQYLDGSTPRAQRKASVDAFQAGEGTLFLISLKAGGFGLNLTGADYVIHTDPWWNPAVEAQATDRAHRIGQERPVTVYRLITQHTIEESIVELHQTKRAMADALLEGGGQAAELDSNELVRLIAADVPLAAAT